MTELKPWVRVVVTAYVLTVVPLLLGMFGLMLINTPRIVGTAWDSFFAQYHKVQHAFHGGSALTGTIGILQMLILILPVLGIAGTVWMMFRRVSGAVWTRTEGMPSVRIAYGVVTSGVVAALAYVWWPNSHNYQPILPGERGTVAGAVHELGQLPARGPSIWRRRPRRVRRARPAQTTTHARVTTTSPQSQTTTLSRTTPTSTTPTVSNPTGTYIAPSTTSTPSSTTTTDTTPTTTTTTP